MPLTEPAGHHAERHAGPLDTPTSPVRLAEILRRARDGDVTWSEWEMGGTAVDGTATPIRGTVIAESDGGEGPIRHTRFHLDPVLDT